MNNYNETLKEYDELNNAINFNDFNNKILKDKRDTILAKLDFLTKPRLTLAQMIQNRKNELAQFEKATKELNNLNSSSITPKLTLKEMLESIKKKSVSN